MVNLEALRRRFAECFDGAQPTVLARAPGRVNLIGEHTDYNEGFCMPAAIARRVFVAACLRDDQRLRVHSVGLGGTVEVRLDEARGDVVAGWMAYVDGLARALRDAGYDIRGGDLLIESEVPMGAGLGSSAALTTACAKAMLALEGGLAETAELVNICVRAECNYVGTPCGVMDPAVSLMAKRGSALLLDCRTLGVEYIKLGETGTRFVLIDSGVTHRNRSGRYGQRRDECRGGVRYFQQFDRRIRALRDVDEALLSRHMTQLDPTVASRCHHVVTENARVRDAAASLRRGDMRRFGELLCASHESLRDYFAVSCAELDRLVELACGVEGVLGARMTGGGFGGSVLILCRDEAVERLVGAVRSASTGYQASAEAIFVVETADGADWQAL